MKKFFAMLLVIVIIFFYMNRDLAMIRQSLTDYVEKESISSDSEYENDNNGKIRDNYKKDYDNYKTIQIGEDLGTVIDKVGKPNTKLNCEYDFKWYVYNQNYDKFFMVGIKDNKVEALFSNTMNSCESENINLGDSKDYVLEKFSPLKYRAIKNVRYTINEDYYSIINKDGKYITVFYDSFEDNKIIGIQIVSEESEKNLSDLYPTDADDIYDFESLNRYMINAERVKRNFMKLSYSKKATICARSHSKDMRDKNYFAHDSLSKKSPFDRMKDYDINFHSAAENIAAGQSSAIFAHYALMNSSGHRINILGNYQYIGVGVVLGGSYKIYFTQNFYSL